MRHLYAGRAGRRQVAAGAQPRPQRDRGPLLAGRESLPVHRLRQDRPRGHGDRCRHAGGCPMNDMTSDTGNKWIGKSTIRPDGSDKFTGRAAYAADATMPGMIWATDLRSPHPHAVIRGIDTPKAEGIPGVTAVGQAEDFVASA